MKVNTTEPTEISNSGSLLYKPFKIHRFHELDKGTKATKPLFKSHKAFQKYFPSYKKALK